MRLQRNGLIGILWFSCWYRYAVLVAKLVKGSVALYCSVMLCLCLQPMAGFAAIFKTYTDSGRVADQLCLRSQFST